MAGEPGQYRAEQQRGDEPGVRVRPAGRKPALVDDLVPGAVDAANLRTPDME